MSENISGLAGRVRACTDSDQFDLSGYSKEQCLDLAKDAFEKPIELPAMIRISFVVGGGKLCRQKYRDDLVKDMCTALSAVGYDEDKAGACELNSAGTFKYQHDTSKNLKFVHVFPRIVIPSSGGEAKGDHGDNGKRSPADVLAAAELDEFKRLTSAHVVGYTLLRRLLDELKDRLNRWEASEKKLIAREALDESEQALYDTLSADGLRQKVQFVAAELQALVDSGKLTSSEKTQVLEQLESKLISIDTELKKVESEGKPKLQQKLEEQKEKLKSTKASVTAAPSSASPPLRHGDQIRKLSLKLAGLERLAKDSAGHYTIDELKRLGERPEIEEAISELQARSRFWLETDQEFQVRLEASKKVSASKR